MKPRTRKGPRLFLGSEAFTLSAADSLGRRRPERGGGRSRRGALQTRGSSPLDRMKPRTRKGPRLFLGSDGFALSAADSLGRRSPERGGGRSRRRALQTRGSSPLDRMKPRTRKGPRLFLGSDGFALSAAE